MLRLKDFLAENIDPETLARLVRNEQIIRPARGLYQLPDAPVDASHMLVEAAVLVPKGIVCLISALQFTSSHFRCPPLFGWRLTAPHGSRLSAIRRFALFGSADGQ